MARQLVSALEEPFTPAAYTDDYRDALMQLVAEKQGAQGKVTRPTAAHESTEGASDLMAALRASVQAAEKSRGSKAAQKGSSALKATTPKQASSGGARKKAAA